MEMTNPQKAERYIQNLRKVRALSKPQFSPETAPDVLLETIQGNAVRCYEMVRENNAILSELIYTRDPVVLTDDDIADLEDIPCILVINLAGQQEEQNYYETIIGLQGEFLFADTMQEARLKIITGQGYLPVDIIGEQVWFDTTVSRIPLMRNAQPVRKTYCAFWKKDNSGYYMEEFAELLKGCFS